MSARRRTAAALLLVATATAVIGAGTPASASGGTTKWKDGCEVVVWAPVREVVNGSAQIRVPAQFKCSTTRTVSYVANELFEDRDYKTDRLAGSRGWHDFTARANTWYRTSFIACDYGATHHTTQVLMVKGWSRALAVDSERSYVWC